MKRLAVCLALLVSVPAMAQELVSLVLSDARLVDLARIAFGKVSEEPFVLSSDVLQAEERYTIELRQVSKARAVSAVSELVKSAGFEVTRRGGVVWIGKPLEAAEELIVYRPRFRSARYLADVVQSVTAARSVLARAIKPIESKAGAAGPVVPSHQAPALVQSSPTSVEGQVDRSEVDQIAFTVAAKEASMVHKLLKDLDTPSGEVVLKAAVYEVGVSKAEGSAVQLAIKLSGMSGTVAGNLLAGASIKFSQGGIEAVLSALDADSRFKSVSRPQVRVRNGAQARFSVGQDVPVLGQVQVDKSGNPVQSVEYKQSGVILNVSPEIREDVIEISLSQELSNFVRTTTGVNGSPTLIKRSVNTKLGLLPGEVVVLAGLQDEQEDAADSRLPFLGWLMGRERQERRSEVLIFLEVVKL